MNSTVVGLYRWPRRLAHIGYYAAILAGIVLIVAGPGYRLGILPLEVALLSAAAGFLIFIFAFAVGLSGLIWSWHRGEPGMNKITAAVVVATLATIAAIVWIGRLHHAPPIHDVTTDLVDPPAFKDVIPLRAATQASNPSEYQATLDMGGQKIDVPDAQRKAFPDIQPVLLTEPPPAAFQHAAQAAHAMGWEIVTSRPEDGRIEATDTTFYFGFKDDVVIRVRPNGAGSRIDVRSLSRIGGGDVGANAARITRYINALRKLVED
jgi:uncharacterized protein (DUF1499 family)